VDPFCWAFSDPFEGISTCLPRPQDLRIPDGFAQGLSAEALKTRVRRTERTRNAVEAGTIMLLHGGA